MSGVLFLVKYYFLFCRANHRCLSRGLTLRYLKLSEEWKQIICSGRWGRQSEAEAQLRLKMMREAWKEDLIPEVWGRSAKSPAGC